MKELPKRILSGIAITAVTAAGVLINEYLYALFVAAVGVLTTIEYYRMAVPGRFLKEKVCIILAEVFALAAPVIPLFLFLPVLLIILCFFLQVIDGVKRLEFDVHLYFPLLYILVPLLSSYYLIVGLPSSQWLAAPVIAITWIADMGAYFIGMALGQRPGSRKLAPEISPHKSWAGVAGAVLFALLSALLAWVVYRHFGIERLSLPLWLEMGLLISVAGIFGDLFESLIKRHFGVKDSSHFIPGHGGVLDRFDDLLFVFPIVTLFLFLTELFPLY